METSIITCIDTEHTIITKLKNYKEFWDKDEVAIHIIPEADVPYAYNSIGERIEPFWCDYNVALGDLDNFIKGYFDAYLDYDGKKYLFFKGCNSVNKGIAHITMASLVLNEVEN